MLYSGYAVSHMNPELYKVPFIGADSIEKQLQELIIRQQKLTSTCRKLETVTRTLQAVQLQTVISDDFIRQLEDGLCKAKEVEQLEQKIKELRDAQTPESLQELLLLDQKLDEAKKKKNELYMLQVEQESRRRQLEGDMKLCNARIQELQQQVKEAKKPEQGIPDTIGAITTADGIRRKQKQLEEALRELNSRVENSKLELITKKHITMIPSALPSTQIFYAMIMSGNMKSIRIILLRTISINAASHSRRHMSASRIISLVRSIVKSKMCECRLTG